MYLQNLIKVAWQKNTWFVTMWLLKPNNNNNNNNN